MAHRTDSIELTGETIAIGTELDVVFYDHNAGTYRYAFNVTVTDIYRFYAYESWTVQGTDRDGETFAFAADIATVREFTII